MRSRGVQHDPLSDIANIRNTLKGYGDGFTIIKELVQNAEDARASFIHIGWHPGFPDLKNAHPLLHGPAFCMVNDGPFGKEHEEAICRMGLGSKGAEEHSIGRFGLGLKSVFHLCEAFFFLASDEKTSGTVRLTELFNPWHGGHHAEWERDQPDDQEILRNALLGLLPDRPWFALWLPLRRKIVCKDVAPIIENFPGDEDSPPDAIKDFFSTELSDVLPLLKQLQEIRYSVWKDKQWDTHYSIKTTANSVRRLFPEKNQVPWKMSGAIRTFSNNNELNSSTTYIGREDWVNDVLFEDLKNDTTWPKVVAIKEDGFDPGGKEKALPHFCNYFTCRHKKDETAKLRIKWAVFLPIGNDCYHEVEIPNFDFDLTLILHGYFFLNSERTIIDGLDNHFSQDNSVYVKWNKRLLSHGNLPTILLALEQFVVTEEFSDYDIQLITNALAESVIFKDYKEEICSTQQWVNRLSDNSAKWCCIPQGEPVYSLPFPSTKDTAFPYTIFSNLNSLTTRFSICFSDADSGDQQFITSNSRKNLTEDMLKTLFTGINIASLENEAGNIYLWNIIQLHSPLSEKTWAVLEDIPLFTVQSIQKQCNERCSLKELIAHNHCGGLFASSGGNVLDELLQSVCPDLNIKILIDRDFDLDVLPPSLRAVSTLNVGSGARTILSQQRLGNIDSRISVLEYFIRTIPHDTIEGTHKCTVRYLLHGDYTQKDNLEQLYLPSKDDAGYVTWNKIIEIVLNETKEPWKRLDDRFGQYLNPRDLSTYGIEKINVPIITGLLNNIEETKIDFNSLSTEDRKEVLLSLNDNELIKRLPIHEKIGGGYVSVSGLSYLENNFETQGLVQETWQELLARANVIKRFEDVLAQAKQKAILPELDWNAAIELALTSDNPDKYVTVIMAGLHSIGTPRQEVGALLRKTKWLPLKNGQIIPPHNVFHIEESAEEIHRILDDDAGGMCGVLALSKLVYSHPGFNSLKRYFLSRKGSLEYLGLLLSDKENTSIGLQRIESSEEFDDFVGAFLSCSAEVMSLHPLLLSFKNNSELLQLSFEYFLPHVQGRVGVDQIERILTFLSSKHKNSTFEIKRKVLVWFNRYFKQAVSDGYTDVLIGKVELLNQLGQWQLTSNLTLPSEGIAKKNLLNIEQAQILEDHYQKEKVEISPENENLEREIDIEDEMSLAQSSDLLIEYFETFEGDGIPREMIGAVGAVLGNYDPIKNWAKKMLGAQSLETIRTEIMPEIVQLKDFDRTRFIVKVIEGKTSSATSLTGESFQVTISENPKSLLFGDNRDMWRSVRNHPECKDTSCHQMQLLSIDNFQDIPQEELATLLQKTAELIIFNVYCNRVKKLYPDIQTLWEQLSETGQRSIITAQLYLLNAGDFYIKQLGSAQHELVRKNLKQWESARQYKVDSEIYPKQKESLLRKADKTEKYSREELKQLLISNDDVHEVFVGAFREKMRSYQYDISSIPFELFQNADDAYQELVNMGCEAVTKNQENPFLIFMAEDKLQFIHWGRCINEHHRQGSFDKGKDFGFDRDLQKMLTLSSSDKGTDRSLDEQSSSRKVTGKFGLGFKSVFFATSSPRILSGRLSFHVRGGFYPQQLDRESELTMQGQLNNLRPEQQYNGTLFELPFSHKDSGKSEEILSRFQEMASIQVVFSKQIKNCEIHSTSKEVASFSWQEQRVFDTRSFFVGELFLGQVSKYKSVLVLRPQRGSSRLKECSLLFQLNLNGFTRLADSIPSIWITAPTQEQNAVGFAINGPFEPDVGRSVLARSSKNNKNLIDELTMSVGGAWVNFYESIQKDWVSVASELRIAHDCSQKGFWESLWTLMSNEKLLSLKNEPEGTAASFLYFLTWGSSDGGYRKLINTCPVIPSRLKGNYDALLSLSEINYLVSGILDMEENLFEKVSKWPSFCEKIDVGKIASNSQIGLVLRKNTATEFVEVINIGLRDAIKWELGNADDVSLQNARRIGLIVNKNFERSIVSSEYSKEYSSIKDRYKKLKFKSATDTYSLCKKLISTKEIDDYITKDETMRAAFAPDNIILSKKYDDSGIQFFAICRGNMDAPSDTLAEWILGLHEDQESQRKAALLYLSKGDLGDKVAEHIRDHGIDNTWLKIDAESVYLKGWDEFDIDELLRRKLLSIETLRKINLETDPDPDIAPVLDPLKSLNNIYDWWAINKDEFTERYERSIYPVGKLPNLVENEFGEFDRSEWLTILLLGAFHTLGRTIPEQHRDFIALCRSNGWWDTFSAEIPATSLDEWMNNWMKVLDQYINDQVGDAEYEHWMNRFPTIYRLARKLDDYAEAFYELDKQGSSVNVEKTLTPRIFEVFEGGGIDAAPIARTLGMGACFVLREMKRSNLLKNKYIVSNCYVPVGSVRKLMECLRCEGITGNESYPDLSKIIHSFLCGHLGETKAEFLGSFDLPLYFVAKDQSLQNRLLN